VPVAGQFIADFCAPSIGLIVEVDGAIHARKLGPDAGRDLKLRRAGFRIVRVSAELVLRDLGAAVAIGPYPSDTLSANAGVAHSIRPAHRSSAVTVGPLRTAPARSPSVRCAPLTRESCVAGRGAHRTATGTWQPRAELMLAVKPTAPGPRHLRRQRVLCSCPARWARAAGTRCSSRPARSQRSVDGAPVAPPRASRSPQMTPTPARSMP
jgi:hypothetical protein